MDVLVSGASGLIGTALRPALIAAGHRPVALVRRPARVADEITWDPATGRLDRAAIEGMGAAIHLAGVSIADKRWSDEQRQVLRDSRVQSTGLLARAIAEVRQPPPVLVSIWFIQRSSLFAPKDSRSTMNWTVPSALE